MGGDVIAVVLVLLKREQFQLHLLPLVQEYPGAQLHVVPLMLELVGPTALGTLEQLRLQVEVAGFQL